MAQLKQIQQGTMRLQVQSLASLIRLGILRCRGLWCGLQMWFGSRVAVVVVQASGYSPDSTPSLGTSICHKCGPKKTKKKKRLNYEDTENVSRLIISKRLYQLSKISQQTNVQSLGFSGELYQKDILHLKTKKKPQ